MGEARVESTVMALARETWEPLLSMLKVMLSALPKPEDDREAMKEAAVCWETSESLDLQISVRVVPGTR